MVVGECPGDVLDNLGPVLIAGADHPSLWLDILALLPKGQQWRWRRVSVP